MFRPQKSRHLRTGARGESIAVFYLRLTGYRVVKRNFRCRMGEIDIIARKDSLLVFVEVRTRAAGGLLHPLETVGPIKVARTVNAARLYLARLPGPLPRCRFDIVAIITWPRFPVRRVLHIKDAFNITSNEYREGCQRESSRRRRWFG